MSKKTKQGLNLTDIKGKGYVEVNERIRYFRENFEGYSLVSNLVSIDNGICVFEAQVLNPEREIVANGFAYEKEGSTFINKTSYIENCETSAWGRALANFGIGIDTSVSSADEVGNAIKNQEDDSKSKNEYKKYLTAKDADEDTRKKYREEFYQRAGVYGFEMDMFKDFLSFLGVDATDGNAIHNATAKYLKDENLLGEQVTMFIEYRRKQMAS